MLSPPAQLKVDKFPHHEGLSEADGGQDSYPKREWKQSVTQQVDKDIRVAHILTPLEPWPANEEFSRLALPMLNTRCIVVAFHSNLLTLCR